MSSPVEPLARDRRHPADYRDELEHADVAAALSELPEDHPARITYYEGSNSDSISLSRLVAGRPEVVKRLVDAYLAMSQRIRQRHQGAGVVATKVWGVDVGPPSRAA
jgi:hypothetical protein